MTGKTDPSSPTSFTWTNEKKWDELAGGKLKERRPKKSRNLKIQTGYTIPFTTPTSPSPLNHTAFNIVVTDEAKANSVRRLTETSPCMTGGLGIVKREWKTYNTMKTLNLGLKLWYQVARWPANQSTNVAQPVRTADSKRPSDLVLGFELGPFRVFYWHVFLVPSFEPPPHIPSVVRNKDHSSTDWVVEVERLHIDEFRIVLGGRPTPCFFFFFYNRIHEKQFFTLPVVHDHKIVQSTSDGVEGKSGLICLVRYSKLLVPTCFAIYGYPWQWVETNGDGWPPKTMRNSSIRTTTKRTSAAKTGDLFSFVELLTIWNSQFYHNRPFA